MSERKIINEMVDDVSMWEFEGTLQDVLLRVEELYSKHGPDARLDYNAHFHYDYEANPSPRYELYVKREENDKEFMDRRSEEQRYAAQNEARDKAEFERLSAKFGAQK